MNGSQEPPGYPTFGIGSLVEFTKRGAVLSIDELTVDVGPDDGTLSKVVHGDVSPGGNVAPLLTEAGVEQHASTMPSVAALPDDILHTICRTWVNMW